MPEISERAFEDAIERALLADGPDAEPATDEVREPTPTYGTAWASGGYHRRRSADYDRALGLIPGDVLDFIVATQPKPWARLKQHHGAEVHERFLKRLAREIERRGTLDVLRKGVKDSGCKFQLAYFRPSSGLNEELERLYRSNLFTVVRQLRYSEKNDNRLDLVLFLNGLPLFTAELKNRLTGQDVRDAIRQYERERDPREPLLAYGRCLAHFAVDPDLVYVTTRLAGAKTRFLLESYRLEQTASGRLEIERRTGQLDPMRPKDPRGPEGEEIEPLSVIIAALNERFGLHLGPEHRVTLGQMMAKLDEDPALKNFLFDQYLRTHRQAEELVKQQESKTLEFKSTLRWNLREERKDPKVVTHAVLKTIAAFLNTEGGDLVIGVADDKTVLGIAADGFENEDKYLLHLSHVVTQGLGDRAGTSIDPRIQLIGSRPVCLVGCQRSPEPVFLKWKGVTKSPEGDFYVRTGAQTKKLAPDSAAEYIRTRFPQAQRREGDSTDLG